MHDDRLSQLDVAPPSVVKQAARDFARALSDTAPFKALEDFGRRLHQDPEAQEAVRAFQSRQDSLRVEIMMNAVSSADRADLGRLHRAMLDQPSVRAYLEAQERLTMLCQSLGERLSHHTGIDYSAACGTSCCG